MDIREFSDRFNFVDMSEVDRAVNLIYFKVHYKGEGEVAANEIANSFVDLDFSRPNVSRLKERLRSDPRTISRGNGRFQLHKRAILEFERSLDLGHTKVALRPVAERLNEIADQIYDDRVKMFVAEAIGCINANLYRAAIVLSWQGALYILQQHAINSYKAEISDEIKKRGFIKKPISKIEDFQRVKESEFLICAEACGLVSKSSKATLEEALNRRNRAGHPNDVTFSEISVASHLEDLINIIYSRVH